MTMLVMLIVVLAIVTLGFVALRDNSNRMLFLAVVVLLLFLAYRLLGPAMHAVPKH